MRIVTDKNILSKPCDLITSNKTLFERANALIKAIKKMPWAIGLADNQIGGHHRIFVAKLGSKERLTVVFNPSISHHFIKGNKEVNYTEECLSLGKEYYPTKRWKSISLEQTKKIIHPQGPHDDPIPDTYLSLHRGKVKLNKYSLRERYPYRCLFHNRDAQVIQHEIDHLDGILISDKKEELMMKRALAFNIT